jgi:cardiolipin synthase
VLDPQTGTEQWNEPTAVFDNAAAVGEDVLVCRLVGGGNIESLADHPRQRIWIASPYFVTDESIRSALQMVALRGVDVRIMIPDKPAKVVPWLATFSFLAVMEAAGVRVFRYQPGFLHQKVLVVDEVLASVEVISREELARLPGADVAEALRQRSGIEIARTGGPGQQT